MPRKAVHAAFVAAGVLLGVLLSAAIGGGDDKPPVPVPPAYVPTPPAPAAGTPVPPPEAKEPFRDPFAYDPDRREEFEARAAAGNAHVIYARSPGGATETAARVSGWRAAVTEAAEEADVDADMLEALVLLESAGRPDAVAPAGLEGAAGLTQIVAETAVNLLGMRVDLRASRRLARRMTRAAELGDQRRYERLRERRAEVDERFSPTRALAATGRYLRMAEEKFGSEELAFVSYHMGMGNLDGVLRAYAGGATERPLRYAQVYFDSSPTRHAEAYERLAALGDDSSNYLWKLLAARDIMRAWREDPAGLRRLETLHTAKASAEEVLHPPTTAQPFAGPDALQAAWDRGEIVPFPVDPAVTGLRMQPKMGELAPRLGRSRTLYRGLRPEALALALYIGAQAREASGDPASTLTVTSTVRDRAYQRLLIRRNGEATRGYSLHTTGWAFDVLRRYRSRRHALAFQFVLDRLQSLNLIAWAREPAAIHITAGSDAAALVPLLDRLSP